MIGQNGLDKLRTEIADYKLEKNWNEVIRKLCGQICNLKFEI